MMFNKKQKKHVFWDWKGTLMDDAWMCVELLNKFFYHSASKISLDYYRDIFEFPFSSRCYKKLQLVESMDSLNFEGFIEAFGKVYHQHTS